KLFLYLSNPLGFKIIIAASSIGNISGDSQKYPNISYPVLSSPNRLSDSTDSPRYMTARPNSDSFIVPSIKLTSEPSVKTYGFLKYVLYFECIPRIIGAGNF